MSRSLRRGLVATATAFLLATSSVGSVLAYEEVHIPTAACDYVLAGIAHFHDSPAPAQMQETPAWGNTSRFVYDGCD
jgi:hypothetical protein